MTARITRAWGSFSSGAFHLPACFSPDGAQLLTTDQKSELRVYSASQWDCPPSLIPHPHRHFQHLTPIKVSDGGRELGSRGRAGSARGRERPDLEMPNPRSHPVPTRSHLFSPGTLCNFCPPSAVPLHWVFLVSRKLFLVRWAQPTSLLFCPHLQLSACAAGPPADLSPQD